jgi:DNA polymerase kappa
MTSETPEDHGQQPENQASSQSTLKYHLLGPSLTKAGQDKVDQKKVSLWTFA